MFLKQAKTIELVRNWLQVSKPPNIQYGHHFANNVCDTLSNNIWNAETNAALKLQEETIFYPKIHSVAAMFL